MGPDLTSKFLGAMLGSALGDAVGELAFYRPSRDSLLQEIDELEELRYTDDTAMALGLAESLVANGRIVEQHLGNTFARNFDREPWRGYALGPPTIFAAARREGISYQEAAKRLFGGVGSYGNGAAMRVAPVGLFFCTSDDLYDHARRSAQVTHSHPVGVDGAAVQALAVAQAVTRNPTEDFRWESFVERLVAFSRTREIRNKMEQVRQLVAAGSGSAQAALEIGRSVAVQESMPFAVYAFVRHPSSYEGCLLCAVLNGGDRDTLGAMAGAISGAYLGAEAIPERWAGKLENADLLTKIALQLKEKYRDANRHLDLP